MVMECCHACAEHQASREGRPAGKGQGSRARPTGSCMDTQPGDAHTTITSDCMIYAQPHTSQTVLHAAWSSETLAAVLLRERSMAQVDSIIYDEL